MKSLRTAMQYVKALSTRKHTKTILYVYSEQRIITPFGMWSLSDDACQAGALLCSAYITAQCIRQEAAWLIGEEFTPEDYNEWQSKVPSHTALMPVSPYIKKRVISP